MWAPNISTPKDIKSYLKLYIFIIWIIFILDKYKNNLTAYTSYNRK